MTDARVIALGFFDGVHIGHGALLREAKNIASALGLCSAALSFDVSPAALIGEQPAPLISSKDARCYLMKSVYGIDKVLMLHFDEKLMQMPWQDFIEQVLILELHAAAVVCGRDYRFGFKGEGTAELLSKYCAAHHIGCTVIDKVKLGDTVVSSTTIRKFLASGDFETALRFLGHPHVIAGAVIHGNEKGRTIGFPTVNIPIEPDTVALPYGVYFGSTEIDGREYICLCNIGLHPTVKKLTAPILEAHIIDFEGNLYGKKLFLKLYAFYRSEKLFSSLEALKTQVLADKTACIRYMKEKHLDA